MKPFLCALVLALSSCATTPATTAATATPPATTVDGKKLGSLDPEIIRRIVREHAGQIRYCYESELARTPGISGKIIMKWVINREGNVVQASTAETQMNNDIVESCLAARIKGWKFPEPRGGGIVIVNYPFVFRNSPAATAETAPPTTTVPAEATQSAPTTPAETAPSPPTAP